MKIFAFLKMAKSGTQRNARNYELAYQNLERFADTNRLMFSRFTAKFINDWIESLKVAARAKEMYSICIRQIFKAAIKEYNDFDNMYIRIKRILGLKSKHLLVTFQRRELLVQTKYVTSLLFQYQKAN